MRRGAAVAVGLAAALLAAAVADARIVLHTSIAGVELGMSNGDVLELLGAPTREHRDQIGRSDVERAVLVYPDRLRVVVYRTIGTTDGEVVKVETRSPKERTPKGLGVGTLETTIARRHPKARCEFNAPAQKRYCYLNTGESSGTSFEIGPDFRVAAVAVYVRS